MKVYIASSWRNRHYPEVVSRLRDAGFEVYDFRNPTCNPGFEHLNISGEAFMWSKVGDDYMEWSPAEYRERLHHHLAERQFGNDMLAMESCDACVIVLPCGRYAHTEAGWFAGRGKKVIAFIPERQEPELMYKLFHGVAVTLDEVAEMLEDKHENLNQYKT